MEKDRVPLISVTDKDCEFKDTFGSGPGGQHRNKSATAIHCTHKPSGARGFSQEYKSQRQNKEAAFKRMVQTKEFQSWIKLETSKRLGIEKQISEAVERQMANRNIKTEVKNGGRWEEVCEKDLKDD